MRQTSVLNSTGRNEIYLKDINLTFTQNEGDSYQSISTNLDLSSYNLISDHNIKLLVQDKRGGQQEFFNLGTVEQPINLENEPLKRLGAKNKLSVTLTIADNSEFKNVTGLQDSFPTPNYGPNPEKGKISILNFRFYDEQIKTPWNIDFTTEDLPVLVFSTGIDNVEQKFFTNQPLFESVNFSLVIEIILKKAVDDALDFPSLEKAEIQAILNNKNSEKRSEWPYCWLRFGEMKSKTAFSEIPDEDYESWILDACANFSKDANSIQKLNEILEAI